MAMKGAPYSSRPQHYWDLTIRLFSVITRTLIGGGVLPLCRGAVSVFSSPSRLNGNEGVRRIPQSSCITVTSLSDYLGSNQGHLLEGGLTLQQRSSGCILQPQPRGACKSTGKKDPIPLTFISCSCLGFGNCSLTVFNKMVLLSLIW